MAIEAIQENRFVRRNGERNVEKNKFINKNCGNKDRAEGKFNRFQKERKFSSKKKCWQCGEQEHFRSKCLTLINEENAD